MSDKFIMPARQAAELDQVFGRNGWMPELVKWLSGGSILTDIKNVLLGYAEIKALHII